MANIQIFTSPEFGDIRTVDQNGEPWFVGKDVAAALGYGEGKSLANAVSNHVDEQDRSVTEMMTEAGKRNFVVINESGLYSLILSSKLPGAKEFKRWVISEVIPSIRKTGGYTLKPKPMTEYQQMMADTRRRNARVQSARILTQLAKQYKGSTYEQVLNAHATRS